MNTTQVEKFLQDSATYFRLKPRELTQLLTANTDKETDENKTLMQDYFVAKHSTLPAYQHNLYGA